MNPKAKLGQRENQILEYTAWGASQKEVANFLGISYRTVDNTIRKIKRKLGLQKAAELSAYWFCTHFNISFDLSPLVKRAASTVMIILIVTTEFGFCGNQVYVRRNRRSRIEVRLPVRARTVEISSS